MALSKKPPPTLRPIAPAGWPRGSGYAHGIAARGELLFVAGQVGAGEDVVTQFDGALGRVLEIVRAAGGRGQRTGHVDTPSPVPDALVNIFTKSSGPSLRRGVSQGTSPP